MERNDKQNHLLKTGFFVTTPSNGIDRNDDSGQPPAEDEEPLQNSILGNEGDNEQCMEIDTFTKHPHIVRDQKVVQEYVQDLATNLLKEEKKNGFVKDNFKTLVLKTWIFGY